MRDFSISDETVPAAHRGTYLAFTDRRSDGMRHLRQLARSGLNTVHLLPVNDIATIEERRSEQQEPACDLAALPPDSEQQQECVAAVAERDGFNWGYDPLHYTTPEGSYATDPEGTAAHPGVPPDGAGTQRGRAAGGDRRGLQPHPGGRAGPQVDPRPGGSRLLPAAEPHHRRRSRPPPAAPTPRPSTP